MNASPVAVSPTQGRLAGLGLLRFSGPDAPTFLQGQLSNDTRRLAAGEALLAAYNTPQGRVVSVLRLAPHSTGIIALLPTALLPTVLERMRRYVMRSKVRLEDLGDAWAALALSDEGMRILDTPASPATYRERNGIGVAGLPNGSPRRWALGLAEDFTRHGIDLSAAVENDWRLADIREGLPQVYPETSEAFVAQMLNLDLVDGISFGKGCYTGQEIIARTQHLGRIKRRMVRLRLPPGAWSVGQALRLADGRLGRVTELAPVGSGWEALAVVPLEVGSASGGPDTGTEGESAAAEPVDARELPLPYRYRS